MRKFHGAQNLHIVVHITRGANLRSEAPQQPAAPGVQWGWGEAKQCQPNYLPYQPNYTVFMAEAWAFKSVLLRNDRSTMLIQEVEFPLF